MVFKKNFFKESQMCAIKHIVNESAPYIMNMERLNFSLNS